MRDGTATVFDTERVRRGLSKQRLALAMVRWLGVPLGLPIVALTSEAER